jgi:outer membrane cobalamin receptor
MKHCARLFALLSLFGGATAAVPRAYAQAPAKRPPSLVAVTIEDLMQILVTTASRTSEGLGSAPARVQVVTAAQIERRGYRSVLDVLKDLADFKIDLHADPDYPAQIGVQGTAGTSRMILLIDGIRVSSPTNEPMPIAANYPVHNARQVEIVYGPASALYGADAFSAVINIISKDVADAPGLSLSSSIGQFGLFNNTVSYGLRLGADASLMVSGQFLYDKQPDLSRFYPDVFGGMQAQKTGVFNTIFGTMTSRRPVSAAYDIPSSAHSVHVRFTAAGLDLSLFQNGSRFSTAPAATPDNAVYNRDAFYGNRLLVASAGYTRSIRRVTSVSSLMFSRHTVDPESGYWNVYSNMNKSFKHAYGSMAKAEQQLSWQASRAVTVTAGGTAERFFAIPQGADLNAAVLSRDQPGTILDTNIVDEFVKLRYSNVGAYAQMQYAMTPLVTVTMGARADRNSRYGATFNPRLGLVARPAPRTTLKVLYGTAFLAPSPYQSNSHYGSFYSTDGGQTFASSYWHIPNPNLKPQKKQTVEVNVLQALGARFQISGSAFYSRFSNLIQTTDADQAYAGTYLGWPVDYIDFPVNEGHSLSYGGSLGLDYVKTFGHGRHLGVHAAAAFADGREWDQDDTDASIPTAMIAPVQFRFGADLDWDRWSIAPRVSVMGTQRVNATMGDPMALSRRTLPGYFTVDVNVRRTLFDAVEAFLTIENALDRRFVSANLRAYTNAEEFVGAPQNPRRITFGFSVRLRKS